MATYKSDLATSNEVYTPPVGGTAFVREVTFNATTALALNDVIEMIPVFKGERVVDLQLFAEDLDSGTTLVFDVGDDLDVDRFVDGSTVGKAGGMVRLGQGVAAAAQIALSEHVYTANNTIDILVAAAPTGDGIGKVHLRAYIVAP